MPDDAAGGAGGGQPEGRTLVADGTRHAIAPTGETTSEAVDGNSTKDGLVVFVFPDTTRDVVLQVGEVGRVTNTIPLALRDGR